MSIWRLTLPACNMPWPIADNRSAGPVVVFVLELFFWSSQRYYLSPVFDEPKAEKCCIQPKASTGSMIGRLVEASNMTDCNDTVPKIKTVRLTYPPPKGPHHTLQCITHAFDCQMFFRLLRSRAPSGQFRHQPA